MKSRKPLYVYLIIGSIMFVVINECSMGLIPYGLFFVLSIVVIFGCLTLVLRGNLRYKKFQFYSKIVFLLALINVVLFFVIGRVQNNITKNNAEILIQKIDEYKRDNREYPLNLDLLKPNYINTLPKVRIGILPKDFIYNYSKIPNYKFSGLKAINTSGDFNYWLGYYGSMGVESYYNSEDKIWYYDD